MVKYSLLSYGVLHDYLAQYELTCAMASTWRELFDEPVPTKDTFLLSRRLAWRVDEEFFPLNFDSMNGMFRSGGLETVMQGIIPYHSWGVPWETTPLLDLCRWMRPMVAVLRPHLIEDAEWYHDYDDSAAIQQIWRDGGYDSPPTLTWPADQRGVELLDQLGGPLGGLSVLYRCVVKDNDNPFLDIPESFYRFEYDTYGYCWCAACIRSLAAEYEAVEDDIAALRQYVNWFDTAPNPTQRVLDALVSLESQYQEVIDGT